MWQAEWAWLCCAAAALIALWAWLRPRSKRGLGAGENARWSRRMRTDRPVHVSKHHRLEHVWLYTGPAPLAAAALPGSGPLTGSLRGRQTWSPAPAAAQAGAGGGGASADAGWSPAVRRAAAAQAAAAFDPSEAVNAGDRLLRAQLLGAARAAGGGGGGEADANPPPARGARAGAAVAPAQALADGWAFFARLLSPDGHWPGDYAGPLFLAPGLVITLWVARVDMGARASALLTYLRNHQQADGGWGLHIEGPSTLFGTTMNYVAARLLGVGEHDKVRDGAGRRGAAHAQAAAARLATFSTLAHPTASRRHLLAPLAAPIMSARRCASPRAPL